uniref:Rho GDP-dissociation inhibitor 1 n=1 Tax=Aotus nancymaae TaxID=37293 RepID=A0A2K5CGP1_AOTNA
MSEQEPTAEQLAQIAAENEEDEHSVNYKPPAQKSIQEIQELDKDDERLRKYKEALLARVAVSTDPNTDYMVGSYGPRAEEYEFLTPVEEEPKGMLAQGSHSIKSRQWNLTIKKEWKD